MAHSIASLVKVCSQSKATVTYTNGFETYITIALLRLYYTEQLINAVRSNKIVVLLK